MDNWPTDIFDVDCRQCKRLADFLVDVKKDHPDYHARPVAPFGVKNPKLLIVGLAPGMHGANATGRPFTGDFVKCLPPQNKPTTAEANTCNSFLKAEIESLKKGAIILTLGGIAHSSVLKALSLKKSDYKFAHNADFKLSTGHHLISSYHCSRYNTQTKRLTEKMFHDVFRKIQRKLK